MSGQQTFTIANGELSIPMPDRLKMECRRSGPDWLVRLDRLHIWTDLEPLLDLHRKITEALVLEGYWAEIDGLARDLLLRGDMP